MDNSSISSTNTSTPIQITPINKKRNKGIKNKMLLVLCSILLLIIILAIPVGILSAHSIKSFVCNNFSSNSWAYTKSNCTNSVNVSGNFDQGNTITIDKTIASNQDNVITEIVKKTSPAVVTIVASSQLNSTTDPNAQDYLNNINNSNQQQNIGSGFIVRQDGVIVTNSHVVADTTLEYSVLLSTDKNPITIQNIYRDSADDIAIIKVDKNNLPTLKLGDSDIVQVGNNVIAIGSPLGEYTGSVTNGIISGLNRSVTASSSFGSKSYQGVFQTNAAINPGNSGGPLLNSSAEVVGVNFATTQDAQNISFALPINRVKNKLTEFQNYGKLLQPFLGVSYTQKTYFLTNGSITGALVTQIQANSPAQKAGIQKGDIITKANDKSLTDNALQNIIQQIKIGDQINLSIWRKGQILNLSATIADMSK